MNNVLPKVILVYRDGVIENEDWDCPVANTVKDIQRYEIPAIEQAWKSVGGEDYT